MKKNINPITFIFLMIVCFCGCSYSIQIIKYTYSMSRTYLNENTIDVYLKNYNDYNNDNYNIKIEKMGKNGRKHLSKLKRSGIVYKWKQYGRSGFTEYFGKNDGVYYYGIADYHNSLIFSGENEDVLIREFNSYKNYCELKQ